jgi:Arc/MetJ-type ribon-helix-helix transcriptional regulator
VVRTTASKHPKEKRSTMSFYNIQDYEIPLYKIFFLEYIGSMKIKTSITLSEDLLKAIDEYAREYNNRSEFIEEAVRVFIRQLIRRQQDARDLEIINHRADYLNQEAMDVLTYQVDL